MIEPVFLASCSPRRGGNSDAAALLVRQALGAPCREFRIADEGVRPCVSCGFCDAHPGRCALDAPGDGAKALFDAVCRAPLSVLVSPVYFYHLPAQAKACNRPRAALLEVRGQARRRTPGHGRAHRARPRGDKLFEGAERTLRYMALALGLEWVEPLRLYGLDGPEDLAGHAEAAARVVEFAASLSRFVLP